MSLSPPEAGSGADARGMLPLDPYVAGWSAIKRLVRGGHGWSGHERNVCFLNVENDARSGAPRFVDVAAALDCDADDDSRAAARIDLDFDGDEDLVVSARTSPRVRALVNEVADGAAHVGLRLAGATSNRDGIGAIVRVTPVDAEGAPLGPTQRRTRRAGDGYLAQSSAWLAFGLGRATPAPRAAVTVTWPGSTVPESFGIVSAGRRYVLAEGRGRASEASTPSTVRWLAGGAAKPLGPEPPITEARRIVLARPRAIPSLQATSSAGASGRLFGATPEGPRGTGRPTLVLVWASWCNPCLGELEKFQAEATALAAAGLDVIALGADGDATQPTADTALAALGWKQPAFRARGDSLEILDAVLAVVRDRPTRMPLPAAFLFQADGALAIVYVGATTPEVVRADLRTIGSSPSRRADIASPYPGRWRTRPDAGQDRWDRLIAELHSRDLRAAARELELSRVVAGSATELEAHLRFAEARMRQGTAETLALALEHYEAALAVDGASLKALRGRALCLSGLARGEEAVGAWEAALAAEPGHVETRASLGFALIGVGDVEGAAAVADSLRAMEDPRAAAFAQRIEELSRAPAAATAPERDR